MKKKIVLMSIAAVLAMTAIIGGTLAGFNTQSAQGKTDITTKTLSIELKDHNGAAEGEEVMSGTYMPGSEVEVSYNVTNNVEEGYDLYTRVGLMKRVLATGLCVAMLVGDALPATAIESVSGGDAASIVQENDTVLEETVLDEETVSGNDLIMTLDPVTVDGVTITLTAPAGAIPENAELWAEEIDQTADLAIIDDALEAEEEKEAIEVQQYKAFDIKILVDGEEVQPEGEVTVSFAGDILLPQNENEVVNVYHVSDDAVANDMEAVLNENDEIEMETEHFSVYVVAISAGAEPLVSVEVLNLQILR